MKKYYTDEKNAQIILALLKKHGIRKVVASPGSTNMTIVMSMQNDPYFEMFSSVDERSAAYIACGIAEESGESVVLSSTGATASRNYLSGLTEAFYRKLPILAITSTLDISKIGHHIPQVIDRSSLPKDVTKHSTTLPIVKDSQDEWECEIKVNIAILELRRNGGGPVHINLPTRYSKSFETKELPEVRIINRINYTTENFPDLPLKGKIAIFIGSHSSISKKEEDIIDKFCELNDAVVFCDHTSSYKGKYRVLYSLVASQKYNTLSITRPDVLIHIGEISGDYYSSKISGKEVWRVNEDGEIRDTFGKLRYVFEMDETNFFKYYINKPERKSSNSYLELCNSQLDDIKDKIPELPFSNIWMASKLANKLPSGSTIHFSILNSLRSWNLFEIPKSVSSASNVGGFGIDGVLSSIVGASLVDINKLYFGVIGDLAFFYDMNVLGNRHVGNNLRILLVNNGKGVEFRHYSHPVSYLGEAVDEFIAAGNHFGNKSTELVKHYAEDYGFEYLTANNKMEFEQGCQKFLSPDITDRPVLFEVFTDSTDETEALSMITNLEKNVEGKIKKIATNVLGKKGISTLKKIVGK